MNGTNFSSVCLFLFLCLCLYADASAPDVGHQNFSLRWHFSNIDNVDHVSRSTADKSWSAATSPSDSLLRPNIRIKRQLPIQPSPNLANNPDCDSDIKRFCPKIAEEKHDDLTLLECFQEKSPELPSDLCQAAIHVRLMKLIGNENLKRDAKSVCESDLENLKCPEVYESGQLLACALDKLESLRSQCRAYIQRVERLAFSDFRVFSQFMTDCEHDIETLKCGRLRGDSGSSQQGTLNCLQLSVEVLQEKCRQQVLHFSALQADNVHLDHKLSAACTEDQKRFCPDVQPGSGKVYKCLLQYRMDRTMSQACQDQLTRYQKLVAQDYRVSRGLVRACKEDIRTYHCRRSVPEDKDIRLSKILLCLEGFIRNGSKVSRDCQLEMMEHRKMLMEDYRLSPEIVTRCSGDIKLFCNSLEIGGKTIHCLMEHTRHKRRRDRVSAQCQRALEVLVKDADVGEDWRVDPILREACKPVVDVACQEVRGGDARVIHCLMDKLGTDHMTDACETALLQIQYFVTRDFKLDPQLYHMCREDAVHFCHAKRVWYDPSGQMDPERGPLVLPCLYRYAYHPQKDKKLKKQCLEEVRRVMRQRALSVDLSPEVEQACLDDLAAYCFDKTGKGEETICLQDKLDQLQPQCREVISNITEDQAAHVELNPVISSVCKNVMQKHCEAEWRSGRDEGDMMDCLVKHKNEVDVRQDYKCRAAIEHFQLISLKNYHFTYKFKEACRYYVMRFCPASKTKYEVISCLSEVVRNDTMKDSRHSIQKECRQQLKAQLFQQRENIDLDPRLKKVCLEDINKLCTDIGSSPGSGKVLECLRSNRNDLRPLCHKAIFKVEQELVVMGVDYTLMTTCRSMINTYCHDEVETNILACLKVHRDEAAFDSDCRKVVIHRMIEQRSDYRLNANLKKACNPDIKKFCANTILNQKADEELEGKVVECLKEKFRVAKLRKECENQMEIILRESALNYQLNHLLARMCQTDIKNLCGSWSEQEAEGYEQGAVEECLKENLRQGHIKEKACRVEVLSLIDDGRADIHVDPLLHQACTLDLQKYCADTQQGSGRMIQCLLNHLRDTQVPLQRDCHEKLSQRLELFNIASNAAEQLNAPPNTVGELYHHVRSSPAGGHFMMSFFVIVGVIFILGTVCGRATKRRIANKNK